MRKITFLFAVLGVLISCGETNVKTQFSKLNSANTGVDFENKLTETHTYNYFTYPYMYLGGGVSTGDINNDGLEDVFFTGNMVSNRLYLNKGNMEFEDISESAGVLGDDRWYSGTTLVDINQDGYLDIYCSVGGKNGPNNNVLYVNNQDNTFTERAKEYGIDCDGINMQSTFFDYDNDGDLDLYVITYPPTSFVAPVEYYHHMLTNHPEEDSDRLFRNDDGHFTDVTNEAGLRSFGLSLGVVVSDVNNDGYSDIFVSNDFNAPDFLFINNQDGTFTNQINTSLQNTSFFGMGADIADFNNDGYFDIFQLDMNAADNFRSKANMSSMNPEVFYKSVELGLHHQNMQNSLQLNNGNNEGELPLFSNVARLAGVSSTDWSWGGLLADFDNDGWKDLFITNGIRRDVNNKDFYGKYREFFKKMETVNKGKEEEVGLLNILQEIPSEKLANYMFKNNRDLTFSKKTEEWGFEEKTFSNGVAYSDLDNDGDLDLVINNLEDVASIYRNNSEGSNQLTIDLDGGKEVLPNGSKVAVYTQDGKQVQEHNTVRGYLSSVTPLLHFGLGSQERVDSVLVTWPNKKVTKLSAIEVNQKIKIKYDSGSVHPLLAKNDHGTVEKRFETVIDTSLFVHKENAFDDFKEEILLPHKNSTLGPALAIGDLNGDGIDDYVVGGAFGQEMAIFVQDKNGKFEELEMGDLGKERFHEDLGILIFDAENDGDNDIYIASGGNEFVVGSEGFQDRFYENIGKNKFRRNVEAIPDIRISGLELTASDFDHDGDLDIFVGGRLTPKKYPYPANSILLENVSTPDGAKFVDATTKVFPALNSLGLVTSSTWVDFDDDGWDDLVVVGEWMSIKFFKNDKGTFKDVSTTMLDGASVGWWYDVQKGDFDNDGDQDLIVGNLGKNYKYQASSSTPFKVYLNDFDNNEKSDIVLSYRSGETEFPVRGRQCSSQQMPAIKKKFKDYNSFASASLKEIYTDKMLDESLSYEITSFESVYLENNNGKYIAKSLPQLSQISSINKFLVEDFNKDGNLDVVLAGNLYNSEVETPRNDASFGLYMEGDGKGGFKAETMMESGLKIVGDVRSMEIISKNNEDYILVGKNNDRLQLIKLN